MGRQGRPVGPDGNFVPPRVLTSRARMSTAMTSRRRAEPLPLWVSFAFAAAIVAIVFLGKSGGKSAAPFGEARSTDEPRVVQTARAMQPGRGREARSPAQIPWRGWKDILWRSYEELNRDRLLAVAAGVVFYGLLALFPTV